MRAGVVVGWGLRADVVERDVPGGLLLLLGATTVREGGS
jgi:hypothetical protein